MTSRIDKNVDIFENKLRFKEYAENTIKNYSYYLRLFLEFHDKRLSHLTKTNAYEFLDFCANLSRNQKTQIISSLKLFYKYVLNMKLDYIKMERPRKAKKLPRSIDWNALEMKFTHIENLKHRAILELASRCLLRVSEVVNLKIEDIDSNKMLILIRNSKGNKDRYVSFSEHMLKLLRIYFKKYRPEEYLFNGQSGRLQYSVGSCQKIFKKHIDEHKSFHTCRHSGSTRLVENGINIRVIQDILGHESSRTTEIYTHISYKAKKEAAL